MSISTTNNVTEDFITSLYVLSREKIPDKVIRKAKECLLDYFGVSLMGSTVYKEINKEYIAHNRIKGECHIFGIEETVDSRTSAFINAFNAHVLELDDSHREAMTHLGAPIYSALLAVAEMNGTTLIELLRAAVIAYEAAIRLAKAIQPGHKRKGYHVSGTCCTVGSAIGLSVLLGYSMNEMKRALCAACTSASGLLGVTSGRSQFKPYNIANAAINGVNAALYGKYFIEADNILGDPRGFLNTMSDNYDVKKLLGDGYEIETIYQKVYAACRHCHAPMEAMLSIRKENNFDIDAIDNILVQVYDLAISGHTHTIICGASSAKQSIPYGVAVACLYQDCGISAFSEEVMNDEKVIQLTRQVKVVEDKDLSALVPQRRPAIVTVNLKDGRSITKRIDYAKGEPENPLTYNELVSKFNLLLQSAGIENEVGQTIINCINQAERYTVKELYTIAPGLFR